MRYFFGFIFMFLITSLNAQDYSANRIVLTDSGLVSINKDPRIDLLIKKQAQINEVTSRDARRTAKGFRLLVINTNKRDEAINAKTTVYTNFPELKAYLSYQSPYFKLKVGNFKTREEAENYRKRLNAYFSTGVFIMQDIIEVNPDKSKENEWDEKF